MRTSATGDHTTAITIAAIIAAPTAPIASGLAGASPTAGLSAVSTKCAIRPHLPPVHRSTELGSPGRSVQDVQRREVALLHELKRRPAARADVADLVRQAHLLDRGRA